MSQRLQILKFITMNNNNKIIIINMGIYISYRKSTAKLKMHPVLGYMNNSLQNTFIKKIKCLHY